MIEEGCGKCYFGNVCPDYGVCDDSIMMDRESADKFIDDVIERGRGEYYAEWRWYMAGWDT